MDIKITVCVATTEPHKSVGESIFTNLPYYCSIIKGDRRIIEESHDLSWFEWVNYNYYNLIVIFTGDRDVVIKDIDEHIKYINTLETCRVLSWKSLTSIVGGYKRIVLSGSNNLLPLKEDDLTQVITSLTV